MLRGVSISALVGSLLAEPVGDAEDYDRVWAEEEAAMASGLLEVGPVSWTRDELHER